MKGGENICAQDPICILTVHLVVVLLLQHFFIANGFPTDARNVLADVSIK